MPEHEWKVVPICDAQLKDVRPDDLLNDGHFRICETYRGGGGYDQFPKIARKRYIDRGLELDRQFVVQLYGCNLNCPYCYVTPAGIWNTPVRYTTSELVHAFMESGCDVFHLMGGAPALQLKFWPELISELEEQAGENFIFHSDLLLSEPPYRLQDLVSITRSNCLYAVNVKGLYDATYEANTGKKANWNLMILNFRRLLATNIPIYVTFTNIPEEDQDIFWNTFRDSPIAKLRAESYTINLIDYEALNA